MTFKVGQPVWAMRSKAYFLCDDEVLGKARVYFRRGYKYINARCFLSEIRPRPTLYWSVREWFMSLVGNK